jgi:hypothetical protein
MSATVGFRFSEHFGITPDAGDDWFDLLLTADTRLFVDPFRVYAAGNGPFTGAHDEIIAFFQRVMALLASSGLQPGTAHFQAAERLLLFPEPAEYCLGFGETPLGIGSGKLLRNAMVRAAALTINEGREDIRHFEEMVLFQESIGPDRVSDIVCNVLKARFIAYTQQVCNRHGLTTQLVAVPHAGCDLDGARWDDQAVELPLNPYTGRAVLLVPKRFLRHLPIVMSDGFWDYAFVNYGEQIRAEFNYDVAQKIKGKEVARLARQHPDMARSYIRHFEDGTPGAYDVGRDPRGVVRWYEAGLELSTSARTMSPPADAAEFCAFVRHLLEEYRWIVEQRGGWRLLWARDGEPLNEAAVQHLLHVAVVLTCKAHDVDISPEVHSGRGPVDFKFSAGWKRRSLVETKLANNSRGWHGITTQTPTYMDAEGIRCGYFLCVQFRDQDLDPERIERAHAAARAVSVARDYEIEALFVDARPKPSASKS